MLAVVLWRIIRRKLFSAVTVHRCYSFASLLQFFVGLCSTQRLSRVQWSKILTVLIVAEGYLRWVNSRTIKFFLYLDNYRTGSVGDRTGSLYKSLQEQHQNPCPSCLQHLLCCKRDTVLLFSPGCGIAIPLPNPTACPPHPWPPQTVCPLASAP